MPAISRRTASPEAVRAQGLDAEALAHEWRDRGAQAPGEEIHQPQAGIAGPARVLLLLLRGVKHAQEAEHQPNDCHDLPLAKGDEFEVLAVGKRFAGADADGIAHVIGRSSGSQAAKQQAGL